MPRFLALLVLAGVAVAAVGRRRPSDPDTHIVVSKREFDRLLDMLDRPPEVSAELRREVAEVRRRRPGWFVDMPSRAIH